MLSTYFKPKRTAAASRGFLATARLLDLYNLGVFLGGSSGRYDARLADDGDAYGVQVIGKLPFDDANHKKLLKLILAGPVFPPNRESTPEFQELVFQILKREEARIGIPEIRHSRWYSMNAMGL